MAEPVINVKTFLTNFFFRKENSCILPTYNSIFKYREMKQIEHVFFDLDHTLWDFEKNSDLTFQKVFKINNLNIDLDTFLKSWTAHGNDLNAGYELKYKRFIIIALDQTNQGATGCSIDASVHFIQALEKKYDVLLLDKMNVSYKQGEFVAYKSLLDFKAMAKQKAISKNTIVFNNLVTNIAEFNENLEVPASESWHNIFIK